MKKIIFLLFLLTTFLGNGQTLPLDFELPEDDTFGAFNGATVGVVTDPTDAMNQVLELTSNGADFDGAAINMATYVDLSDDNNNTVTMRFWAPDATSRTHLLKFEGATNGPPATELYFNTNVAGWQDITLDFGPGLANDYPILVLFADSGPGNIATGTYYIDDIDGPNGDAIAPDPIPSVPAPIPTFADSEVYSVYNDTNGYTTIFPFAYDFGTVTTIDLDPTAAVNNTLKYNFGVAGYGQGEGGPDDISAYSFLTFDYWAGPSAGASGWNVELIDNVGGTVTGFVYQYTAPQETITEESWQKAIIPLTTFTGFDTTNFFQWKLDPLGGSVDNAQIVYIDNVLFITNDALSTNDVTLEEIKVFPNPSSSIWNIKSTSMIESITVFDALGRQALVLRANDLEYTIDAKNLAKGLYFAKVVNEVGISTVKLIRE